MSGTSHGSSGRPLLLWKTTVQSSAPSAAATSRADSSICRRYRDAPGMATATLCAVKISWAPARVASGRRSIASRTWRALASTNFGCVCQSPTYVTATSGSPSAASRVRASSTFSRYCVQLEV